MKAFNKYGRQTSTYACFNCRIANKGAHCSCGQSMHYMGTKWRAPKKNNIKAWKHILNGHIWWNKRAVELLAINTTKRNTISLQKQKERKCQKVHKLLLLNQNKEH